MTAFFRQNAFPASFFAAWILVSAYTISSLASASGQARALRANAQMVEKPPPLPSPEAV
jgi:hypothetical protein